MQICFAVWTYLTKGVEIMRYLFFVWAIGPMIVRFIWSIRLCFANGFIFTRIYFVMRMVFFLSDHQFSLHFIRNVVTKYENFRIKLQVEQQIWREKKRKQYINTAFTFDSCKLLVLSHRISCILYYGCYECITFFSKLHIVMIYSYVIDDARWIAFQSAVDARENRYDSLTSTAKKKRKHSIERISPPKKMGQRKCRFLKPQQHTL